MCPPLSPIQNAFNGLMDSLDPHVVFPAVEQMRIPLQYLANLLSAGNTEVIKNVFRKLIAMRSYMRSRNLGKSFDTSVLESAGLSPKEAVDIYELSAFAKYNDRYVIPKSHREQAGDMHYGRGPPDMFLWKAVPAASGEQNPSSCGCPAENGEMRRPGVVKMEEYRLVFKLCSLLFEYPQEKWQKDDLQQTLCLIKDKNVKEELAAFLGYLESTPFETVCEYYVHQFDFRAETSLYLTYGIFGDNMERGPPLSN